jgi:nucleotide-binding universal stress UspA family protein
MTVLAAVGEKRESNPVVELGHDLATAYDDDLIVLHVTPDEEFDRYLEEMRSLPEQDDYSIEQEEGSAARFARRVVDASLPDDDRAGATVETLGRVGRPADEILTTADEVDARYVVLGGRRRSPAGKALFGSTTQRVLLDADRPVVTRMLSE